MSSHDDLSSLPPATLRAALDASEKRIKKEKQQIHREIRRLQRRLEQLEEGEDVPEMELEKNIAGGSRRKGKRPRVDSSSDDGASVYMKPYNPRSTAKARRVDPEPVSPQRYVRSGDETLLIMEYIAHRARSAKRRGCVVSGTRTLPVGGVSLASVRGLGAT